MPASRGVERTNPKRAPDAVASVVAPPGEIVATVTKRTSGAIDRADMAIPK